METLLIIEDDIGIQKQLKWTFSNYNLVQAHDRISAINALRRHEPKVVTLDLGLPPDTDNASEGIATLKEILSLVPKTKVIVITGNDEKDIALKAIEIGAHDFYQKPIDDDILSVIINRAFVIANLEIENENLKQFSMGNNGFIGNSHQIQQVCRLVERIAPTDISTLLLGESGTGKEVLARSIHNLSDRKINRLSLSTVLQSPKAFSKANYLAMNGGHLLVHIKRQKAKLKLQKEGLCSWMKSAICPTLCRQRYCVFCKKKS